MNFPVFCIVVLVIAVVSYSAGYQMALSDVMRRDEPSKEDDPGLDDEGKP